MIVKLPRASPSTSGIPDHEIVAPNHDRGRPAELERLSLVGQWVATLPKLE